MNSLGSLLVPIDASPRSQLRLQLAQTLLRQCADGGAPGPVDVLYATTPSYLEQPFALAETAVSALAALQALDTQRRNQARRRFDEVNAGAQPPMRWHDLDDENVVDGTTRRALLADLVLFGQHDPDPHVSAGVPDDFVESVLIASGRPGLVLPYVGTFDTVGREPLIAWKPTRESARALSAAIPLLRGARRIHLVTEAGSARGTGHDDAVASYLSAHGIRAPLEHHVAIDGSSPGEALLSLAADVAADLLVMGCYGHSRARELVLGGASRTLLRSMTLPVLMAH
ncbi:MAG: universal stress protein [Burkholderiales bacterium]|nr:universal stress protein [Burkholderiales bacterium]